jgi:hypothetical protein
MRTGTPELTVSQLARHSSAVRRCTPLQGHALSRCRGPFDGGDELVAQDSGSEVRHGASPVLDVCRERRVGTPDVEGGRAFQFRERGPFLCLAVDALGR